MELCRVITWLKHATILSGTGVDLLNVLPFAYFASSGEGEKKLFNLRNKQVVQLRRFRGQKMNVVWM